MRIGINIPKGLNAREVAECAKRAEERGYDSVWVGDSTAQDVFPFLAAVAMNTDSIKIGSSVINVFSRRPVTLALGAATIDETSNGRFLLGLGPSHRPVVEKRFGMEYTSTLRRMREATEIIRKIIAGENMAYDGEVFRIRDYKIGFQPTRRRIPIYFGVVGPKMQELAGEIADGLYLIHSTPELVRRSIENAEQGLRRSGRQRRDLDVALTVKCYLRSEEDKASTEALKSAIAYAVKFPSFKKRIAEAGFEREADLMLKAWAAGDGGAAASHVSDALIRGICAVGTPEEVSSRLDEYVHAGLDLPVISAPTEGKVTKEKFLALIDALAPG